MIPQLLALLRSNRVHAWALLPGSLLLAGCASAQGATPDPRGRECTVQEIERFRLRGPTGEQYYVEPRFVLSSGGATFLIGKPSYRFTADTVEPVFVSRYDVFGVVVGRGRETRLIPGPLGAARVKPVAAAALDDGAVGVIFLEFAADADTLEWVSSATVSGSVQQIWYAEYRNGAWTRAERLPMGESVAFNELNGSPLVVSGDTAVWAVPATSRDSTVYVAVFERVGGVWGKHILERAPFLPVTYAALTHTSGHGFVMGLVRSDPQVGYRINSLYAYTRDSSWRRVRGVIPGEGEPVHAPAMAHIAGDSILVTWIAKTLDGRQRARVLIGDIVTETGDFLAITSRSVDTPVPLPGLGGVVWVAEDSDEERVVRVAELSGSRMRTLWEIPSPYTGYLGATATPGGILLSGPYFEAGRVLVTLLIRLRVQCGTT
jgi:hypothetical protein